MRSKVTFQVNFMNMKNQRAKDSMKSKKKWVDQ